VGSLRSLVYNPSAKQNQPPPWDYVLADVLRNRLVQQFPTNVLFEIIHRENEKSVTVSWLQTGACKELAMGPRILFWFLVGEVQEFGFYDCRILRVRTLNDSSSDNGLFLIEEDVEWDH
jgi:hypothetical protein